MNGSLPVRLLTVLAALALTTGPARAQVDPDCPAYLLADVAPGDQCVVVDDDTCGLCFDVGGVTLTTRTCVGDTDCVGVGNGLCNKPSSSSTGAGTTADPYCRIQRAYDTTSVNPAGKTWTIVKPGTYQECVLAWGFQVDPMTGLWDPMTSLDRPAKIFADAFETAVPGGELAAIAMTTISGADICDGVTTTASPTVVLGGTGAILEGFTITGGGLSGVRAQGGVSITSNVVTGNRSESGGGIYLLTASCYYLGSTLLPADNTIRAEIRDNLIDGNVAEAHDAATDPACASCTTFAPCGGGDGGGVAILADSVLGCGLDDVITVAGNTINNNAVTNENLDPCTAVQSRDQLLYTSNGAGLFAFTNSFAGTVSGIAITENTIAGNTGTPGSEGYGGGIYALTFGYGVDSIEIGDNTIGGAGATLESAAANVARLDGGGVSARVLPPPGLGVHSIEVRDNSVEGNLADGNAGGLDLLLEASLLGPGNGASLIVEHNRITGNATTTGDGGGLRAVSDVRRSGASRALAADAVTLAIRRNTIRDNTAGLGAGGALLQPIADGDEFDGGFCGPNPLPAHALLEFNNNLVAGNYAAAGDPAIDVIGAGILALPVSFGNAVAEVLVETSTVAANTLGPNGVVGGIELQAQSFADCLTSTIYGENRLTIDSTLVAANDGIGVGGPPPGDPGDPAAPDAVVGVTFSDVFGHRQGDFEPTLFPAGIPPGSNLSIDPLLDPAEFRLGLGSPVIDQANPSPPIALTAKDLEGDDRVLDGDDDGSAVADIGADEQACRDSDEDGTTNCEGDCADDDPSVYPGAPQECDGVNNDCDAPGWPALAGTNEADDDDDDFSECAGDCDDTDPTRYLGATEYCDGVDNDCDMVVDEGFDADGDGYTPCGGDCNDNNANCTLDCTPLSCNCPVVIVAAAGSSAENLLDLVRRYRDSVMSRTARGRGYVDLFYAHSAELALILATDGGLRSDSSAVLERLAPRMARIVRGQTVALTDPDLEAIRRLLAQLRERSGPALRESLDAVEAELQQASALQQLGFRRATRPSGER